MSRLQALHRRHCRRPASALLRPAAWLLPPAREEAQRSARRSAQEAVGGVGVAPCLTRVLTSTIWASDCSDCTSSSSASSRSALPPPPPRSTSSTRPAPSPPPPIPLRPPLRQSRSSSRQWLVYCLVEAVLLQVAVAEGALCAARAGRFELACSGSAAAGRGLGLLGLAAALTVPEHRRRGWARGSGSCAQSRGPRDAGRRSRSTRSPSPRV